MSKKEKIEDFFTSSNTTTLKDIEDLTAGLRRSGMQDNAKVSLTYLIQALYKEIPEILDRRKKEFYTQGYMQGYKDA